MTFWGLTQILINLVLLTGLILTWIRLSRPAKDDPRLSRGLQLLQSKISVLEDLSDRTETQVAQLTALLERKCKELQTKIDESEKQINHIEACTKKSLEVATIFQDRIPHNEIIERQNTVKYVTAARMAHQGASVDEIAAKVDLSRAEIEFIATVNRDQLQFAEESLPEWARQPVDPAANTPGNFNISFQLKKEQVQETPAPMPAPTPEPVVEAAPATASAPAFTMAAPEIVPEPSLIIDPNAPVVNQKFMEFNLAGEPQASKTIIAHTTRGKEVEIRPFEFPRIDR